MPDSLKRMERRRRGRKDPGPDPWELANSVAEYKCFPSDLGPAGSFPPLFPGGCTKCSPLGSFYMVDPVSKILGHVDLTEQGLPGGNMLRQLVVRLYQQLYTGGIIISPGQLEVLVRAGQERTMVLVTEDSLTSTDLALLSICLASQPSLPSPSVPGLGEDWRSRLLVSAGLVAPHSQGGPLISPFSPRLLSSLAQSDQEVICVPVLLSQQGWGGGGRRARLEVGQPLSLQEMLGRHDLTQLGRHLSVSRARLAQHCPGQLVAFSLQSGLAARQSDLSSLLSALSDLTGLLNYQRWELRLTEEGEEQELLELVRTGVSQLGGKIDERDQSVHLPLTDLELWRLSRGLETSIMSECVVSSVVLGLARPRLPTTAVRENLEGGGGATVLLQQVVDRARELALWTGLDTTCLAPCEELDQAMLEAVRRLEVLECLGSVEQPRTSQYQYSCQVRHRPSYSEEDVREVAETSTELGVGLTNKGRRLLNWLGGVLRYRVTNLGYTARALHSVREMGLASMEEISALVSQEIQSKRSRGWRLSEKAAQPQVTRESVVALAQVNIVNIINKSGTDLVQVAHTHSRDSLEQVISLVLDL